MLIAKLLNDYKTVNSQ